MDEAKPIVIPRIGLALRIFGVIFGLLALGMIAAPAFEDQRFVQAQPEKYARIALFGKLALPLCILAIVLRVEWVLHPGGITRRVGLFVPMLRQDVRLPADPQVVCERYRGRGNSGAVYVSYPVSIRGRGEKRSLTIERFGSGQSEEALAFASAVSALLGIPQKYSAEGGPRSRERSPSGWR